MKKKIIGFIFTLGIFTMFQVEAAPSCSTYGDVNDPACWTSATAAGYNTYVLTNCRWVCGYPLSICSGIGFCHNTPAACTAAYGVSCGSYSSMCHDGCGNSDCENESTLWDGKSNGTANVATWHPATTAYTCHYIDSVTSWSSCVASSKTATAASWTTSSGKSCSNAALTDWCENGACGASAGQTFPTVPMTDLCAAGDLAGPVANVNSQWEWSCLGKNGGANAPLCTAKQFIDIGLRIHEGRTKKIAVWPSSLPDKSAFRVSKEGISYALVLVEPLSPGATNMTMETPDGPKSLYEIK